MTKEEILEKSRLENIDEGVQQTELTGIKLGFWWMSVIYAVVAISNLIIIFIKGGEMLAFYVASSMYFAFSASGAYAKYKFSQEKKYRFLMFCSIIGSVAFFLN